MRFVDVIFNLNINDAFTYLLPEDIPVEPIAGQRVLAPFGRRQLTGVVISVKTETNIKNPREIIDILDEHPLINQEMLEITRWMAEYYAAPWGQAVQLALPKGLDRRSEVRVTVNPEGDYLAAGLTEKQRSLFDLIVRAPGNTTRYYFEKFGVGAISHYLRMLESKGLIFCEQNLSGIKVRKAARKMITVPDKFPDEIKGIRNKDQVLDILEKLKGQEIPFDVFSEKTGFSAQRIKRYISLDLLSMREQEVERSVNFSYQEELKKISLNQRQKEVLEQIEQTIDDKKFQVYLIHGVTGSGKTQVYLEALKRTLDAGRTAVVLIPEISLTPQTVKRFENFFPGKVAVFHSKMSLGERYDAWRRVDDGRYSIVVGPRSALFMPIKNLGIIVVDEEHDNSYKQTGTRPRYHARDVAIFRAKLNNAVVLLGSATPSLESYYNARSNKFHLLEMPDRIKNIPMPEVTLIDMRRGTKSKNESPILSRVLLNKIEDRISRQEQVILMQNRRGFASFTQCKDCGYIPQCPACAIALTYHEFNRTMQCHYCGYVMTAEKTCLKCGGPQLKYQGSGTQKVEKELSRMLPKAKIMRMDQDTTTGKGAHDKYLQAFRERKADILLGTQMISKGLDFPNVTLVGVISAEIGLSLPDFRASERVFQLLTQVAGRAGRDERNGEVVIQSYLDDHYAIRHARQHDFIGFYQEEIKNRSHMVYPPFTRLINIRVTGADLNATIRSAREIGAKLRRLARNYYQVIGPAPCPLTILKNKFRWQLLLKLNMSEDPAGRRTKRIIEKHLDYYLRSSQSDTNVVVDVDPVEMM